MNLVMNAVEAIGKQVGVVSIRTGKREVDERYILKALDGAEIRPGTYAFLEVRDSGCGMDEKTQARIFDPFFTTKFTGRGLGLAAVAGIIRAHRGAIKVTSKPGEGSTFLVLFPLAAAEADRRLVDAAPEEVGSPGTVLVVDDEEVVIRVAKFALERSGFAVLEARSGQEAVEAVRKNAAGISAVILDLTMPGMDGRHVLPELRKIRPDLPVIVSSGHSEEEALSFFDGQEISGFIQKPYRSARLIEKVNQALSQAR
jgi:CheY-like chemotaxis protein